MDGGLNLGSQVTHAELRREWLAGCRASSAWTWVRSFAVSAALWTFAIVATVALSRAGVPVGPTLDDLVGDDTPSSTSPALAVLALGTLAVGTIVGLGLRFLFRFRPDPRRRLESVGLEWLGLAWVTAAGAKDDHNVWLAASPSGIGLAEPLMFGRVASIAGDWLFVARDEITAAELRVSARAPARNRLVIWTRQGEELTFTGPVAGRLAAMMNALEVPANEPPLRRFLELPR